jgi:MFS family permease
MPSTGSMRQQIGTLIVATSVIQLANGFFGTFISLRVTIEDFGATLTGLVLSSYFAGFTLGAARCGRIIGRVGHIRAYAAFAGLVAAATAGMPLLVGPLSWLVLRAVIGFGCAGVFVTTESWLNAKAQPSERGRVFSMYMVGTFLALAVGQLLIGWAQIETSAPFSAIVALFATALVMVSTARAEPPQATATATLSFRQLSLAAPVAVVGCALSGVITGAFYALVPAWMEGEGIGRETIALSMLAAVLGGLALQVPVGQLSDRFDRRIVLAVLGVGFAVAAVAVVVLPHSLEVVLPVAFVLGGFMSTLYPVCVAHAHDRMPADQIVAVSSRLVLVSGFGSVLGPLIGASLKAPFGINGVFYFMAAVAVLLGVVAGARILTEVAPRHLQRPFAILTPQAASLAHDSLGLSEAHPPSSDVVNPEKR